MPESAIQVRLSPHFRVAASHLADWLGRQGEESWWSVDGDPILTQRLAFPCPPDELANELRRLNKNLLLLDTSESPRAHGETLGTDQLDRVVYKDKHGDRVFQLCWEDGPDVDWLLLEDRETGRRSLGRDTNEE